MHRAALVVGINEYIYLDDQDLDKPAADAEAIAKMLEAHGSFRVQRFPEKDEGGSRQVDPSPPAKEDRLPTAENLRPKIEKLFNPPSNISTEIPDTALFYFAGHGLVKDPDDPEKREVFLATSYVDLEDNWGVPFKWLLDQVLNSPVPQKLVWLDCCHSGALLKFDLDTAEDICLLAASRSFEPAYEQDDSQHAVLTGALLAALDPTDKEKGWVTSTDLVAYVQEALKNEKQLPCHRNFNKEILITGKTQISEATLKEKCPYKGLESFDLGDAGNFYGRDALVQELLQGLNDHNFLAVLGASGSGKSSVVRAGLLKELQVEQQRSGSDKWKFVILRPGKNPLESLVRAFGEGEAFEKDPDQFHFDEGLTLARLLGSPQTPLEKGGFPEAPPSVRGGLGGILATNADHTLTEEAPPSVRGGWGGSHSPVLVVVDQFEEVFTLCQGRKQPVLPKERSPGEHAVLQKKLSPEEKAALQKERSLKLREQFISCLLGAKDGSDINLKVVITMRADFLGHCAEYDYSGLAKKIQNNLVLVGPMKPDELRQTIEQPAKTAKAHVEPQLVERMLDEVQGPGTLPLLQYTLWVMWNNPSPYRLWANSLASSDYQQLGGVKGTLSARADEVYDSLKSEKQKSAARWIFMNLTQVGEGAADTRRQVLKSDLVNLAYPQAIIDETVRQLVEARLLVTDGKGGETTVDVAHEALIRHWDKLRGWVDENRKALIFKDKISSEVQEWKNKGNKDDDLLSPGKLDEAENYQKQYDDWGWLSKEVKEYIVKSRQRQKEQVTLPQMRADAAVVQNLLNIEPVNALVLAIKAAGDNLGLERYKSKLEHYVQSSLLDAVIKVRETNILKGHESEVRSVAFSPGGKQIVSGSSDGTIRLWDTSGNPIGSPFKGHESSVWSVAFSPGGKQIVSGSNDGTIRLWDTSGNPIGSPFKGHESSVWSVAFSPGGKQIVSGSRDGTIRLWDTSGNPIGSPFKGHESSVWSVAFSPGGKQIVSGSRDGTIRLWDTSGNPIGSPFKGHESEVWSVAFSPGGKQIVSGSRDGTIRLWRGGSWEDWLAVACDKLQFHPVLAGLNADENAKMAVETFRKYVWDDAGYAKFLMRQGWLLVLEKKDVPGALVKFEEAYQLDGSIDLEGAKKLAEQLVGES